MEWDTSVHPCDERNAVVNLSLHFEMRSRPKLFSTFSASSPLFSIIPQKQLGCD